MTNEIIALLKKRGYSDAAVAGILGNIDVETGGTYDFTQAQVGGGPGRGLFQMGDGMLTAYQEYLKKNKLTDGVAPQINFMDSALTNDNDYEVGGGHLKHIANAFASGSPEQATAQFSDRFLRPQEGKEHMDRRLKSANAWWNQRAFDPNGQGYDYNSARASGKAPSPGQHWGSLDPRTGMVLKGRNHPTWGLMEDVEKSRGSKIIFKDGRYYSVPQK